MGVSETRRLWSSDDDSLLRDYYLEGRSTAWIAERFSTTQGNVRQRASRLGVKREPSAYQGRDPRKPAPPSGGLAARLAQLQGLTVEPEASPEPVSDDALHVWIEDPEAFFAWLGMTLFPYQREALALIRANPRVCIVWPRQHGKDTITALYGLWNAIVRPSAVVVCVSPSQRQSDLWMDNLKALALGKREIRDSVTDLSQTEIAFSNGSRVYSLPSGAQGSATIRGFSRVSLVVANEAAWIADETFQAVQPFLAVTGKEAKLVLASTPFGQTGYLWRAFNSDVYARHHVTSILNPLIPADFIDKERASMDSLSFAAEYQAQFLSAQNAYFPTELVQRCVQTYSLLETPLPEHDYLDACYLGCDWARVAGADRSVLTVVGVDEGHGKVLWLKSFDGIDYTDQAAYVAWLHSEWVFDRVYSDASAHAVNDLLRSKGVPVEPIQFSQPSKVELFSRLKASMESGKLTIPDHPDLLREFSTFQYKISENNNLLLHHVAGGHDDYPDSLALAARDLTQDFKAGFVDSSVWLRMDRAWGIR